MYIADKRSCYMLKLAAKFGFVSDLLYIAMHFYKAFRYREALSLIEMTKVKLAQPGLAYRGVVCPERYMEAVGGQSLSTKMRQAAAQDILLSNGICYINELIPEQHCDQHSNSFAIRIPLFVLLHFVEFLCYRHTDTALAQTALEELQVLVHYDQGWHISNTHRDISWEILGICQQLSGNHQAALDSFQHILTHFPRSLIQAATQMRIQDLHIT